MWNEGAHPIPFRKSTNDELDKVKGTLSEAEAQQWFARYCLANPAFMVYLLTRVKLDPVQDLLLRSFILKDYCLLVAGRGFSKSFVISLFCIIYHFRTHSRTVLLSTKIILNTNDVFFI